MAIQSIREWIDACAVDHLVEVELGDETREDCNYSIALHPAMARELATKLNAAADDADKEYAPADPDPITEQDVADAADEAYQQGLRNGQNHAVAAMEEQVAAMEKALGIPGAWEDLLDAIGGAVPEAIEAEQTSPEHTKVPEEAVGQYIVWLHEGG